MTGTRSTADMRAAADRVVDDARSTGQEVQAQVLDTVRMSQKFTLAAIRAWSDAVQSVMPPLPSTFPFRPDNLPKPEDVVANASTSPSSRWLPSASSRRTYSGDRAARCEGRVPCPERIGGHA